MRIASESLFTEMYDITRCPHFTIIRVSVAHNIDRFATAIDVVTQRTMIPDPKRNAWGLPFYPAECRDFRGSSFIPVFAASRA